MKTLIYIKDHIKYWAESYLGFPIAALFILFTLHFFGYMTQRSSPDQPDAIVAFGYNAFGAIAIMALTGFCQARLFGYRSNGTKPKLCDDIYDSVLTVVLLLFFSYLVFHK